MELENRINNIRVDRFLCQNLKNLTRSKANYLIASGHVSVNGKMVKKGELLREGDIVHVNETALIDWKVQPDSTIELDIIFESPDIIAIAKPGGIHSHPLKPEETNTVLNGALALFPEIQYVNPESLSLGLVHRLDRGTSGILLIARNQNAFDFLRTQWKEKKIKKEYLALVHNIMEKEHSLEGYLCHEDIHGKKMRFSFNKPVNKKSWFSRSIITPLEKFKEFTLVKLETNTGVTHQVRAHLSFLGFPVAGDELYGGKRIFPGLKERFFLHASRIEIPGIKKGKVLAIEAPIPFELKKILEELRNGC
jgi:23S rRNA pseudouridine1911/1915/1917 synthase